MLDEWRGYWLRLIASVRASFAFRDSVGQQIRAMFERNPFFVLHLTDVSKTKGQD